MRRTRPGQTPARPHTGRRPDGFASATALAACLLVAAAAIALLSASRQVSLEAAERTSEVRRRADAMTADALARSILRSGRAGHAPEGGALDGGALRGGALRGGALQGGALEGGALYGGETVVDFAGATFRITVEAEDLKPDLNRAEPALVAAFLADGLDPGIRAVALERFSAARRIGLPLSEPDELLPYCLRFSPAGRAIAGRVTTATGQSTLARLALTRREIELLPGVTPAIAALLLSRKDGNAVDREDPRLAPVARFLGQATGLYTVVVTVERPGGPPQGLDYLMRLDDRGPVILRIRAIAATLDPDLC